MNPKNLTKGNGSRRPQASPVCTPVAAADLCYGSRGLAVLRASFLCMETMLQPPYNRERRPVGAAILHAVCDTIESIVASRHAQSVHHLNAFQSGPSIFGLAPGAPCRLVGVEPPFPDIWSLASTQSVLELLVRSAQCKRTGEKTERWGSGVVDVTVACMRYLADHCFESPPHVLPVPRLLRRVTPMPAVTATAPAAAVMPATAVALWYR